MTTLTAMGSSSKKPHHMPDLVTPPRADVFGAIASPVRRRLLDALVGGPVRVHDLASAFTISRPAVSQHLRVLRQAGLVAEKRVGKERQYTLNPAPLRQVDAWLAHYESFWQDRLAALRNALEV